MSNSESKLTENQLNFYEQMKRFSRENGYAPTTREMQKVMGYASQTGAIAYFRVLEKKGYIERHKSCDDGNCKPRAIKFLK